MVSIKTPQAFSGGLGCSLLPVCSLCAHVELFPASQPSPSQGKGFLTWVMVTLGITVS